MIIAGLAALAATAPAAAKPGHGKNNAHAAHAGHAYGVDGAVGYGVGGCPPGLAKKSPRCIPPGQAKKLYNVGQRLPYGFNGYTPYNQIPYDLRNQYGLDPYGQYIYDQNYLYRVDPKTQVISSVLNAILR
jgi:hypothetical protein